ncbi:hypothetical protein F9B85_05145 [Heliorestis acidaminivorans]|uniref:Uncharacterized protein n=1 Tax=Heliorestis acidaminivorans TaxID=553427 RepID=A0A6I0ETB2_9FIRM|nr:hypothetical protein [Heliorestis acidaminivorans]KAB2953299.1 hypothetical protein F9B85_05145 [Heliorestis acidaminivorans]
MKELAAYEQRPDGKPVYIEANCPDCGSTLVLHDLLVNPDIPVVWHDEFACPQCQDRIFVDQPTYRNSKVG